MNPSGIPHPTLPYHGTIPTRCVKSRQADVAMMVAGAPPSLFLDDASANADMLSFRNQINSDFASYEERRLSAATVMIPEGSFVQRLKAGVPGSVGMYYHNLTCLRPVRSIGSLERRHCFDRELLSLKLKRGRACKRQTMLCRSDRCGLHVVDGVLTAAEAAELIAHGESVIRAEGSLAYDLQYKTATLLLPPLHSLTSLARRVCACVCVLTPPLDPSHAHMHTCTLLPIDRPSSSAPACPAVTQLALQARRLHAICGQWLGVRPSAVVAGRRETPPTDGRGVWAAA